MLAELVRDFYFMAKELPFFKFEISEWMFGRIQKQPLSVQGIFINLCCKYWHKLGELSYEDACLDFGHDNIKSLHDARIIGDDEGYIFIKFLDRQLDECEQTSKKNSLKGLKSAQVRATRRNNGLTVVQQQLTAVQPNPTEEKRREDKREEEIARTNYSNEFYQTAKQAFEEVKNDELLIERLLRIVHHSGFKSCNEITLTLAVRKFMTIEDAKQTFVTKDKQGIKEHLVNWVTKHAKTLDEHAT